MQSFQEKIKDHNLDLSPLAITTLQVNITKLCNQACHHCHVDSSPKRRESLSDKHLDQVLAILAKNPNIEILDITGGAPELHPKFRTLVKQARLLGKRVMVRHNLTVTFDPHPQTKESMRDIPAFFKEQGVEVISSLPYYREYLTDKQRGSGVFKKSIEALKALNQQGFGREQNLILNLVYNPIGRYLPGPQENLEKEYKRELKKTYEIDFNHLFVLTNMPIHRFKRELLKSDKYEEYMEKLHSVFNPTAASGIMCRSLISVSWDGKLFDCDFNQMLEMEIKTDHTPMTLDNFDESILMKRKITFADHCYGCTAGAGSSCGGKTT